MIIKTFIALMIVATPLLAAEPQSITLWNRNFDSAPVDQILALAFSKTLDGLPPITIVKSKPLEQDEALLDLNAMNTLDVMSAATSIENDHKFLTIKFPVFKGLLGHRICLIRRGEQHRFNNIVTAFDFQKAGIRICQGKNWPDTRTLLRNGFDVVTSSRYLDLFPKLIQGECDCFLRGSQEILNEMKNHAENLTIEKNLVIFYTQPGVIYVNKAKPDLAARIELGLLRALDDGSYDKLINTLLGSTFKKLKLHERNYLILNNPFQSGAVKSFISNKAVWYQP